MSEPEPGLVVQQVLYAGLDAMRAVMPLDLCAYLHAAPGFGPQLYLRSPDLSSMDATEAFDLFGALRDALNGEEASERSLSVGGFDALAILTVGDVSRGVSVMGRRGLPLDETEAAIVRTLCRAMGVACHAIEASSRGPIDAGAVRMVLETIDGQARAQVSVPLNDSMVSGQGEASSPAPAVALATLDAVSPGAKLHDAVEGEVGGERAMIVLVSDETGHMSVGAALCGDDALLASATATLNALGLRR